MNKQNFKFLTKKYGGKFILFFIGVIFTIWLTNLLNPFLLNLINTF